MEIQLKDNVKSRTIDEHQLNEYKPLKGNVETRSQIATYDYLKKKNI